uniref:Mitochondrial GTPase 1 n=1 Tax=Strigamia maritima TaxID=126957 RepID=T1JBA6_STRMM
MANSVSSAPIFRQSFTTKCKELSRWFPRHMFSGLKQMQQKLKSVDCIIEVHDARISFNLFQKVNPQFYNLLTAIRPHILVLTKIDLANTSAKTQIIKKLKEETRLNEVLFSHHDKGIRKIIPTALELIQSSNRYNRETLEDFTVMTIGIPNVGKSSLINCLRARHLKKAKATQVGASPGVTKSVLERIKIHDEPKVYLLDTPGVTAPDVRDIETGLKLALCAILQDHVVGEHLMVDYLLYWLNKNNNFNYVDYFDLTEPCDDVTKLLLQISVKSGLQKKVRAVTDGTWYLRPNLEAAASLMIKAFREGDFGLVNLDNEIALQTNKPITEI